MGEKFEAHLLHKAKVPMSIPEKPWSVDTFERERPHLTSFVKHTITPRINASQCRRIVLRAPVKCGKREIVEYTAMRDKDNKDTRVHAFLSAWHRVADEDQRNELGTHNLAVFSITNKKNVTNFENVVTTPARIVPSPSSAVLNAPPIIGTRYLSVNSQIFFKNP